MSKVENLQPKAEISPSLTSMDQKQGVYYAIAFLILVATMNGVQNSLITKSKELKACAAQQSKVNASLKDIVFETVPAGASITIVHKISEQNKIIAGYQEELQELLVNLRQGGQILMTQGNGDVNSIEQDANSDSTILQTIHTILSLINGMSPVKGKQK